MKNMIENQRVGGKGIDMWLTRTNDMQSHRRRVVMQQAIKQNTYISSMTTHKLWQEYKNQDKKW